MAYSETSAANFHAPVFLGDMFQTESDQEEEEEEKRMAAANEQLKEKDATTTATTSSGENQSQQQLGVRSIDAANGLRYEVTTQLFPSMKLVIRQFDDHHRNANICWPEARCLAQWLIGDHLVQDSLVVRKRRFDEMLIGFDTQRAFPLASETVDAASPELLTPPICPACSKPRRQVRVFELGSATGALAIYLSAFGVDMHTSDLDDTLITENIACNYRLNNMTVPVHLPHSWGINLQGVDEYDQTHGAPDVILGSDILAYEDDFGALVETIEHLMPDTSSSKSTATITTDSSSSSTTTSPVIPLSTACCLECALPPAVLYMCWKRSCNKGLLEDGFWRVMHERNFGITTRGNKTYEIRRGRREVKNGQYVEYVRC